MRAADVPRWPLVVGSVGIAQMPLWRTYYHIVWATKERRPLIATDAETGLYGYLRGKAHALGLSVHAIGGTADHLHVILSIPPTCAVGDAVRHLKGASSHQMAQRAAAGQAFRWQRGYGVFTLGPRHLVEVIAYVQNQRSHHHNGTTIAALERTLDTDDGPLAPPD